MAMILWQKQNIKLFVLNEALQHENLQGNGSVASCVLSLDTT